MRVGIVGGTFDPVHQGHLGMAEEARKQLELERVIFMPAGKPWLKDGQTITGSEHRVVMLRLAVSSNPEFEVSLKEIERPGPTYTVDTLEEVRAELGPSAELYFLVGMDAMEYFQSWKEPDRLLSLCNLAVAPRPGHLDFDWPTFFTRFPQAVGRVELLTGPLKAVSGTQIRRRVAAGGSLSTQVPGAVADYIADHKLYTSQNVEPLPQTSDAPEGRRTVLDLVLGSRILQVALDRGALKYGDFTLTSGRKSSYYFDGRLLSLDPEGAHLIAKALLPVLRDAVVDAVGGPTLGADPIVAAIGLASYLDGDSIPAFIVRKEAKAHGTGRGIEGPLTAGCRVAIIDDVCTTGGSLFHAIAAAEALGCTVSKVLAVLDRREGGSEELRRRGYDFVALLAATPEGKIEVSGSA